MVAAQNILDMIVATVLNPIAMLLFAWGFFQFIWGLFNFMRNLNVSSTKEEAQMHMIYGVVGMFVMVAVWGIVNLVANTLGLQQQRNGLWE
jgi:hypothetical protein